MKGKVNDVAAEREARQPHTAGEAVCLACRHQWASVAPVGTNEFECPACHTMRGVWFYPLSLPDGEEVWQCICGGELYMLTRADIFCVTCGRSHDWRPE